MLDGPGPNVGPDALGGEGEGSHMLVLAARACRAAARGGVSSPADREGLR